MIQRRVYAAAGRSSDGRIWAVPPPGRHDKVIRLIYDELGIFESQRAEQGFVDQEGVFMTRAKALIVARASGQVTDKLLGSILTSEDLW